jgi:DNA-binding response OmpR family regulator
VGSSRTVLVVEGEPDLREAMAHSLRRRGYEVQTAGDAAAAEDLLARGLPHLLVTDMMLPGPSGFQVARLVAERSDGRVPVVMVSASTSPVHRDYAFASGVDTFLARPVSPVELAAAVEELCPLPAPRPAPRPAVARS